MNKYDVSLVLACYNEHEIFADSVTKIIKTLNQTDYTWEIIFVEDKSQDNTAKLIKNILKTYPRYNLSAIFHQQNLGRGKTVTDGFLQAQGKYVGFLDIDLEIGEWYIPKFLSTLEAGADVVSAWRIYDFQFWSLPRYFASKGYVLLRKLLLGLPYKDTEAGYKFFKREKLTQILPHVRNQGWFFDTEIMALAHKHKLKVHELPVAFVRNEQKTSTVKLIPDTINYLRDLLKFSLQFKRL